VLLDRDDALKAADGAGIAIVGRAK
jgi:hypothetical protein